MRYREIFIKKMENEIDVMNTIIDRLYFTSDYYTKYKLLNNLKANAANLSWLVQGLENRISSSSLRPDRVFTPAELAQYDGKNGSPAYVAVNKTVYDVTDNAAWGGATHFGHLAGQELTAEFMSEHGGQQILSLLPVVGEMTE